MVIKSPTSLSRVLSRLPYALLLVATILPLPSFASPITDFTDLKELKGITADMQQSNDNEARWFPPDSNFGKLFLEPRGAKLIISWLGTVSKRYSVEPTGERATRSIMRITATYRSRRNEETPIELTLLVPHPRSASARELNLIPEFTDLERGVKSMPTTQHLDMAGFPADHGVDFEKSLCRLYIQLPRQSALYLESKGCESKKKLLNFCESIDIVRLAGKLEK